MYKVYGSVTSRAFRVLWMLEEIGEPYDYIKAGPRSEAVTALNPSGKIPVLTDGNVVITDSTAILTYLADKHRKLTFPAGTIERAHQDALTHAILDELDAVLWTAARHGFVLPEEHRVPDVKPSLKWEFARNLDRLADRMAGPFLQGEQMTIADIIATHCLNWAIGAKFPVENEKMNAYAKAMRSRDAFKRVRGLDDA
ncbi:glutathione S-transferase family protein [Sedimentitalea sp. JM2-8]|uniref:Glutathione S-transferase family protein n=1 Tax=Sedimentitalea xiamensis TaxID=3050037 RepID=A0ABT7F919_9RHOB|nr:glutathione S-transferase family protein [Sedimentitalea xiamensis]MDK3071586.1 glutathione S-transferase family protein [Sedimentitalea xiamensis]